MVASSTTTTATATAASQLVGFSAAKRSFPSPAVRPRSWIVTARLEGSSKSVGKLSGLRCASNPRRIRVERTGNSYASMEADEDEGKETNSAPISAATEQKRSAKIHDFCFGIPFGGVVLSGGIIGFLFSRNPATLGTGVLYGSALLALSTFSLKIWRQGKSCLPYILGQGALAAALLWKNFQAFSLTKKLFPTGFYAAISAAMLCFYSYVLLSGGNPPPKKLKSSPSFAS